MRAGKAGNGLGTGADTGGGRAGEAGHGVGDVTGVLNGRTVWAEVGIRAGSWVVLERWPAVGSHGGACSRTLVINAVTELRCCWVRLVAAMCELAR